MITLTSTAGEQVRLAMLDLDDEDLALRLAAKEQEDGSLALGMGFDLPREHDLTLESEGVIVLVSPISKPLLENLVLDYAEIEPGRFGFVLVAAEESPGCGTGGCGGCGSASSC